VVSEMKGKGEGIGERAYVAGVFFQLDSSFDVDACEGYFVFEVVVGVAVDVIEL
jgi:hypothetical protein